MDVVFVWVLESSYILSILNIIFFLNSTKFPMLDNNFTINVWFAEDEIKIYDSRQNVLFRTLFVKSGIFAQNLSDLTQFGLSHCVEFRVPLIFRPLKCRICFPSLTKCVEVIALRTLSEIKSPRRILFKYLQQDEFSCSN